MRSQVSSARARSNQVHSNAVRAAAPEVRQELGRVDTARHTLRRYVQRSTYIQSH